MKLLPALAASAALCASSLAPWGAAAQTGAETMPVAVLLPRSGPSADSFGTSMLAGINYVFDSVNASGGLKAADGKTYKLALKAFDDPLTDVKIAQTAAQRALDERYKVIIGPVGSGSASAVQPQMARSDAFWLIAPSVVPGPTKLPNVFRAAPLLKVYNEAVLDWLKMNPNVKTVAMATDQTHTGLVAATGELTAGIEALGRKVVATESFKQGDKDFRAMLTSMLGKNPDLYLHRGFAPEAALSLEQIRELGGKMPVMWNSAVTAAEVRKLVADEATMAGVVQAATGQSLDPFLGAGMGLAVKVKEAVGDKAGTFTATGHDAAVVLVEILKRSKSMDKAAISAAAEGMPATALAGKTLNTFNPQEDGLVFKAHEVNVPGTLMTWQVGKGWVASR